MKSTITPGKLFNAMSAEFRAARDPACCTLCTMPLPVPIATLPGEGLPNWTVAAPANECEVCKPVIAEILRRYQDRYELFDPVSAPVTLRRAVPQSRPASPFH